LLVADEFDHEDDCSIKATNSSSELGLIFSEMRPWRRP
jgi:hypothetical protein